jgi:hypothetical protein
MEAISDGVIQGNRIIPYLVQKGIFLFLARKLAARFIKIEDRIGKLANIDRAWSSWGRFFERGVVQSIPTPHHSDQSGTAFVLLACSWDAPSAAINLLSHDWNPSMMSDEAREELGFLW